MQHEIEFGYIGLGARDRAAVDQYLGDVIGLMRGEPTSDGASTWRLDRFAQRIVVHTGDTDDAIYAGVVAVDRSAYRRAISRLESQRVRLEPLDEGARRARRVSDGVRMMPPWQVPLELAVRLDTSDTAFAAAAYPQGLVTDGQGLGHAVFFTDSAEEYADSCRFLVHALGMTLSDTMDAAVGPTRARAAFYHCNRRHHSIAIGFPRPPQLARRLHHICIEAPTLDDVGFAFDRAVRFGTPIANALGRHPNDRMLSFYSVSPGGWQVEVGGCGVTIPDVWDRVADYDRVSEWGHQPATVLGALRDRTD